MNNLLNDFQKKLLKNNKELNFVNLLTKPSQNIHTGDSHYLFYKYNNMVLCTELNTVNLNDESLEFSDIEKLIASAIADSISSFESIISNERSIYDRATNIHDRFHYLLYRLYDFRIIDYTGSVFRREFYEIIEKKISDGESFNSIYWYIFKLYQLPLDTFDLLKAFKQDKSIYTSKDVTRLNTARVAEED